MLDFYRADLDYWLAIGVVRDVADNFLRLRPPRLNKCVDGLEVKMTQGEISRRRARNGPAIPSSTATLLRVEPRSPQTNRPIGGEGVAHSVPNPH